MADGNHVRTHPHFVDGFHDYLGNIRTKSNNRQYFLGMVKARTIKQLWEKETGRDYRTETDQFHARQRQIESNKRYIHYSTWGTERLHVPCVGCPAAILCRDYKLACQLFFHWAAKPAVRGPVKRGVPCEAYYKMTFKIEEAA